MASPPALGEILETYGPDGTCWGSNQDIADTCDNACYEGLKMWNSVSPEIVECAPPPNGIPPTMDHHFFFAVPDATPDDQYVSDLYFHAFVKIVDDGHIDLTVQPHLVNSSSEPPPGELIGMSLTYKMVVVEPNGYFDTGTIDYMMPAGSGSFGGIVVEMGFRGVFHEEVICGDFHGVIPGQYGEDDYPLDGALIGVPVEEIGEVAVDYEDLCE